jgi:hypothetical protein
VRLLRRQLLQLSAGNAAIADHLDRDLPQPGDGRDYIMSYNDCCGKTSCGSCFCNRNEGERPMYRMSLNNDVNWCMANDNPNYHCSVSVVLGVAGK